MFPHTLEEQSRDGGITNEGVKECVSGRLCTGVGGIWLQAGSDSVLVVSSALNQPEAQNLTSAAAYKHTRWYPAEPEHTSQNLEVSTVSRSNIYFTFNTFI